MLLVIFSTAGVKPTILELCIPFLGAIEKWVRWTLHKRWFTAGWGPIKYVCRCAARAVFAFPKHSDSLATINNANAQVHFDDSKIFITCVMVEVNGGSKLFNAKLRYPLSFVGCRNKIHQPTHKRHWYPWQITAIILIFDKHAHTQYTCDSHWTLRHNQCRGEGGPDWCDNDTTNKTKPFIIHMMLIVHFWWHFISLIMMNSAIRNVFVLLISLQNYQVVRI